MSRFGERAGRDAEAWIDSLDPEAIASPDADAAARGEPVTQQRGRMTATFVYLIGSPGTTLVKIGRATSPHRRLETLQTGSPLPLELRAYWEADEASELRVHRELAHARRHGEWFDLGDTEPIKAVSELLGVKAVVPRRRKPRAGMGQDTRAPRFISIADAATYADVSTRTIRRYIATGRLPGYRVGARLVKVDVADLERLAHPIPTAGMGNA